MKNKTEQSKYSKKKRRADAELDEAYAEIRRLKTALEEWNRVGTVIMETVTGNPGLLSDSDVIGAFENLCYEREDARQVARFLVWSLAYGPGQANGSAREKPLLVSPEDLRELLERWPWLARSVHDIGDLVPLVTNEELAT